MQAGLRVPSVATPDSIAPRRSAVLLLMSYVTLVGVGTGIGLLLRYPLEDTAIVRFDERVAVWFSEHRTPDLNDYTVWGSDLADTFIKIAVTAVLALLLFLLWRRWVDPLMLIVSLVLEASVFITVTWLVRRPRPDVLRLEGSPVDSSFPSGHTAAAAAYGALVVVVFWHTRNRLARVAIVLLCAAVTAIVGLSRMYRGMHYLTDVVIGVVLGVVCVAITARILSRTSQPQSQTNSKRAVRRDDRRLDGVS